jgi:FdhD protein
VISSRAGFEIIQKAIKMGVQAVVCLGAGSQMAIDLAIAMALPLYTFAKMGKSNRFIGKSNESHQASHN